MNTFPQFRFGVALLTVAFAATSVRAQAIGPAASLNKLAFYVQTGPATVKEDPQSDGASSFRFSAFVSGVFGVTSSDVTNSFTLPNNGATRALSKGGGWGYSEHFASETEMSAAFPTGTYQMTFGGRPPLSVPFSADLFPDLPWPALSAGSFNTNGDLVVDRSAPLTITIRFDRNYLAGFSRLTIRVSTGDDTVRYYDVDNSGSNFNSGRNFTATPLSLTVPANFFNPGQTYILTLGAGRHVSQTTIPALTVTSVLPEVWAVCANIIRIRLVVGTPPPPTFSVQPSSQAVAAGATVVLVAASPNAAAFQWRKDGVDVAGATSPALTFQSASAAQAGTYTVVATNNAGSTTSSPAALTVSEAPLPVFTAQPRALTVAAGATVVFNAAASGAPGYQWRKDGASIAGATGATLVIQNVSPAQAGAYSVVATNSAGSTTSAAAALTIAAGTTDPGRLINLSILTPLAANETMTLGTVLGGAGTSGAKPLLVRAAGPSLAPLGVTGFLQDPTLALVSGSRTVATNNDWGGTAALSNAFAAVGAFGFTSAASKDAAIFQPSLASGGYTVLLSDAGTGSGTVIAELYDASGSAYTAGTPRLVNVSVLKQIAAGGSLTAGFVVGGTTATSVLIRAVGPTLGLAPFGLDGVMPDPQLKLFDQRQALVAANDNWGGDASIAAVANRVGAFALSAPASKDAVLLLTLAPGSYTAEASPVTSTAGGTAIVEIYEVR